MGQITFTTRAQQIADMIAAENFNAGDYYDTQEMHAAVARTLDFKVLRNAIGNREAYFVTTNWGKYIIRVQFVNGKFNTIKIGAFEQGATVAAAVKEFSLRGGAYVMKGGAQ